MSNYREKIFSKTEKIFRSKGYKYLKSKDTYEKKVRDFKFKIQFYFYHRSVETAMEIVLSIEHLPTEKIFKKSTGFSSFGTIGNEVGKLINNDDGKIKNHESFNIILSSDDDLDYAYNKITFILNEIAEPYFKNYGDLEKIDSVLNNEPDVISRHRNDQYNRYPLGLIVAKLNSRKNYLQLKKKYDELIKDMSEMYIERYNQVKQYLKDTYEA